MNMKKLVAKVAKGTSLTQKQAQDAIKVIFESIAEAIGEGERVQIYGFGSFYAKVQAARVYPNRFTAESKETPEKKVPKFKASTRLKAEIAGK